MEALVPASMEIASPWSARSTALFIWEADTVPPLTPALPEELEPEPLASDAQGVLRTASAGAGLPAASPPARFIRGAIYVSCSGRGGPHFGGPSAELQIVRHALGDVPLVGFFAGGEIARHQLYGYTGVLTVFVSD